MIGSELLYFSDNSGCTWHIIHLQKKKLSLEFVYSLQGICLFRPEGTKMAQEQRLQLQLEREKAAMAAKEAKRVAKEEAARQKEHVR